MAGLSEQVRATYPHWATLSGPSVQKQGSGRKGGWEDEGRHITATARSAETRQGKYIKTVTKEKREFVSGRQVCHLSPSFVAAILQLAVFSPSASYKLAAT